MTNIRMKALDQLHISSVQADTIAPGDEFEVTTAQADDLEARGLAKRVLRDGADAPPQDERQEEKAAPEPANKMEQAPANKAATSRRKKGTR